MKAILKLERIGHGKIGCKMPWVAEIVCKHDEPVTRHFLQPNLDFSQANGEGSRGVYALFTLKTGKVYEVFAKTSWSKGERYFVEVSEGGEIERHEKLHWR